MADYDYDLFVIGSGPAGQRGAIQAAKLRKRVGLAERRAVIGGVCINTGTIPSKTLREAVMHLTGYRHHLLYGDSYSVKQTITMEDLMVHADRVIANEVDVTRHQLLRNGVELFAGEARFIDAHTIHLDYVGGAGARVVTAANILITTGTFATRDPHIPFDDHLVLTSEDVLKMKQLPRTMAVVGAGVIGLEYASMFAALGVRVTLIDKRHQMLPFIDTEIMDTLVYHMRQNRMTLRLGEEVSAIAIVDDDNHERVQIHLRSGKVVSAEKVLYSIGRTGATDTLNLEAVGVSPGPRGYLEVNESFQTAAPTIYAAGDIIGFPSLAATSMEQGRLAACHAFGVPATSVPALFPYGIYAIPEISFVGRTEEDLTEQGVPYEVGKAQYKEIARGQIIGDQTGMMKLIFHCDTRELLGVHILGAGATELVHIGQAVMALGGGIDYFVNTVFNYPTLAECYKTAALDAANRLAAV